MLKDVLTRIEERLAELGMSATKASREAGLSEDAIRNMRRAVEGGDRKGVSTDTILALAKVLQTTAGYLMEGSAPPEMLVPVLGYVGADSEGTIIYATGQGANDLVPLPGGGGPLSRALEVRGHSGGDFAPQGSIIYFEDQRNPPTPDMIGHPCVVETQDDRVLLKRLLKGSRRGLFDLESIVGPTIPDIPLRWAALVTFVAQPHIARKIRRHAGMSQVA